MLVGGAIVVAAIVGFVVFVTTQGDADRRDRRERAAAAAERAEDDLATRVEVNRRAVPDGFETPEPTSPEVADLDGWDRPEFCRAARSLMSFEKRGLDSGLSGDLDDYLATIVSGRDRWKQDVDAMIATDPPGMTDDLVQYRGKYERFLWSFSAQTAPEELEVLINEVYKDDFTLRAGRINRFVQAECG